MAGENTDLQIDNIRIGFGDDNPAPEPTPVDRTEELVAVMETLADWLDQFEDGDESGDGYLVGWVSHETVSAVAQILELTQLLMHEHGQAVDQINEFLGMMALAREQGKQAAGLIIANAGDMKRYIQP